MNDKVNQQISKLEETINNLREHLGEDGCDYQYVLTNIVLMSMEIDDLKQELNNLNQTV